MLPHQEFLLSEEKTYEGRWWVTRPKFNLAEEHLACLFSKLLSDYKVKRVVLKEYLTVASDDRVAPSRENKELRQHFELY